MYIDRIIVRTGKTRVPDINHTTAARNLNEISKSCIGTSGIRTGSEVTTIKSDILTILTDHSKVSQIIEIKIFQLYILTPINKSAHFITERIAHLKDNMQSHLRFFFVLQI